LIDEYGIDVTRQHQRIDLLVRIHYEPESRFGQMKYGLDGLRRHKSVLLEMLCDLDPLTHDLEDVIMSCRPGIVYMFHQYTSMRS